RVPPFPPLCASDTHPPSPYSTLKGGVGKTTVTAQLGAALSALVQRSEEGRLLQHFLPIFDGKSAIVPNADSMAYAELNLTMQWLLRLGRTHMSTIPPAWGRIANAATPVGTPGFVSGCRAICGVRGRRAGRGCCRHVGRPNPAPGGKCLLVTDGEPTIRTIS